MATPTDRLLSDVRTAVRRRDAALAEIARPVMRRDDGSHYPGHREGLEDGVRAQEGWIATAAGRVGMTPEDLIAAAVAAA